MIGEAGGATKPVPNTDDSCHCLLSPDVVPEGFIDVSFDVSDGTFAHVAYDPACPHHGEFVRLLSRSSGPYSIGVTP